MERQLTTWVEIDLAAIRHNMREVRNTVSDGVKILAVVKADAYGCGAAGVSRVVIEEGASCLGVTRIEDAMVLRRIGIEAPVLLFDSILPEDAATAVEYDLEQTVCSTALARALSEAARAQGKTAGVHVKIDTGLGRLGVHPDEAVNFIRAIAGLPGISIAGVYTHFATAGEKDARAATAQLDSFEGVLRKLRLAEVPFGMAHAAASAAILRIPRSHLDMVRPGTILYGQYPSAHIPRRLSLRDPFTLKSRISFIRTVQGGTPIGYGSEYRTRGKTTIAIVPIGYADGLTMQPASVFRRRAAVTAARSIVPGATPAVEFRLRGKTVPVLGRVAMEMSVIDVTDIPGVEVGDLVTIPCRRTAVPNRIPRIYVENLQEG